ATYTFGTPTRTFPEDLIPQDFQLQLAMVVHARDAVPFEVGKSASRGLKILAEESTSSAFIEEVERDFGGEAKYDNWAELARLFFSGQFSIELDLDRPCITYAHRIADEQMMRLGHDWFIGFSNQCATDEEGKWLDAIENAAVVAYDAGTKDAMGMPLETPEPVSLVQTPTFVGPIMILSATRAEE
ncbi:MAG: hypothetical protein F4130_04050, partial [Acidobacteria bacterium]|nr:hypothetical protein [Acidobacteriota bacterium]